MVKVSSLKFQMSNMQQFSQLNQPTNQDRGDSVPILRTLKVYTKKLNKTSYHMATFNEPLCSAENHVENLPQHIIEEPASSNMLIGKAGENSLVGGN